MSRPETLLLLFVLFFSPLAFGAVEPWSQAIAESAVFIALAIALRRRTSHGRLLLRAVPGLLPLGLFLGLVLFQLLPLPPWLVRLLSPAAYARWQTALGDGGALPWVPLSLDPLATLGELVRFGACGALYVLTVQLLAQRERLRGVTTAIAAFAATLAFSAILQSLVSPRHLLFVRPLVGGTPFGPYVNRNHYANLMALLLPVLLGLFLARPATFAAGTLRARLVGLLARPGSGPRILLGFSALLVAASLVLSLSRGAMLAASAAILCLALWLLSRGLARRRTLALILLLSLVTVFVGWFGWQRVADRFAALPDAADSVTGMRAGLARDTLRMAADFPVFGAGIGSFARLYPSWRTVPGTRAAAHAHNDHLELLAGAGALGFGCFAWFVVAALRAALRGSRRRRDPPALCLAFGALAGCAAFLVHGVGDFSLAIGANALYFFFLLGLAVSAAHTLGPDADRPTLLARAPHPGWFAAAAAGLALLVVLWHAADLTARHAWRLAGKEADWTQTLRTPSANLKRLVALAARFQPLEAEYPSALARIALREGNAGEALRLTRRALRLRPLDSPALAQLAALRAARGEETQAHRLFAAAIALEPLAARPRETYGAWLLSRGDRRAGAARLREALALDPPRAPRIFALLALGGFDDRSIGALVPPQPAALLKFARYAETTGSPELAEQAYRQVLALEPANAAAAFALERLRPRGGSR